MKTYIAHYEPLKERRKTFSQALAAAHLTECEWITAEPTSNFLSLYTSSPAVWDYRNNLLNYPDDVPFKKLSRAELSLLFKHYLILEQIASSPDRYGLVLEDDAVFDVSTFKSTLKHNILATPSCWDFIFIGSGCNLRIHPSELLVGKTAYLKSHPASKCTDSFLVKKTAAQRILTTFFPFAFPADFELNFQMFAHSMAVYWWEPPIVIQGSQSGLYESVIQP
jgi:GR25 family glycosyltransferase involved in LPS biosynthesis